MPQVSRRDFLAYLASGTLALFAGRVAGDVYHAGVTRHRLVLPIREPLRVAQLSDLHYGPYIREGSVRSWVAQAQAENADLIVITGDVVDRWLRRPLAPLTQALSGLHAPLGVWACLGNHDRERFGFADIGALARTLAEAGITLLVNQGVLVRNDLFLAAVDDLSTGHSDLEAALRDAPGGVATLLLCHQPDFFPEMTLHVDLTLAGHTHGGQVRLPFIGTPVTSSSYGERYLEGWAPPPDARFGKGYVSRGLGVSMLPVRLNCPAELAVFDIAPGERSL
jgi:predicted MPP superfamily phosphohydrolase